MITLISVWVKCPLCGWNEIPQVKYDKLRDFETNNGMELIDAICNLLEFDADTMHVKSSELLGSVQKHSFTIKSKVQVEHSEINQAELEVRMVVHCKGEPYGTGAGED